MNRNVLIRVATPAVILGVVLLGTCLVSAWHINRLHTDLASILSENVTSLEAAQDLEIEVRQLRFHSFLYLMDPTPERLRAIDEDQERFEKALAVARDSASSAAEEACVEAIDSGYQKYHDELAPLREGAARGDPPPDFSKVADAHPIRNLVESCQEISRLNKSLMEQTAEESFAATRQAQLTMLLLGLVGPLGGLSIGYGMARGLSRSIAQLQVRVQGITEQLGPPYDTGPTGARLWASPQVHDIHVGSVSVATEGDIRELDRQLQHVVRRVAEVAERLQQQQLALLRAEQLAAVGQLAAGVAHEVRNPLASMKMLVESAMRSRNRKPLNLEDLGVIHGEIARLEQTVQGLLDFARPAAPQRRQTDLREVITRAVDLIRARANQQRVEITLKVPTEPTFALIDPAQLGTVLVNLLINALDALPSGGRIEVSLARFGMGQVQIAVRDTGPGIPADMLDHLFLPFASSKPTGTGLGLSISHRIVQEHDGNLQAVNRPEGGACFTVTLPRRVGGLLTKGYTDGENGTEARDRPLGEGEWNADEAG